LGSFQSDRNEPALGDGEAAAIRLALSEPDSLLLIDETDGRSMATRSGVAAAGGKYRVAMNEGVIGVPERTGKARREAANPDRR
jgi:predicted nucleic acid-binding protein